MCSFVYVRAWWWWFTQLIIEVRAVGAIYPRAFIDRCEVCWYFQILSDSRYDTKVVPISFLDQQSIVRMSRLKRALASGKKCELNTLSLFSYHIATWAP